VTCVYYMPPCPTLSISHPTTRGFKILLLNESLETTTHVAWAFSGMHVTIASTWGPVRPLPQDDPAMVSFEVKHLYKAFAPPREFGFVLERPVESCTAWRVTVTCGDGEVAPPAMTRACYLTKPGSASKAKVHLRRRRLPPAREHTSPHADINAGLNDESARKLLLVVLRGEAYRDGPSGTRHIALQLEASTDAAATSTHVFGMDVSPMGTGRSQGLGLEAGEYATSAAAFESQHAALRSIRQHVLLPARTSGWATGVLADVSCPRPLLSGLFGVLRDELNASSMRAKNFSRSQVRSVLSSLRWANHVAWQSRELHTWSALLMLRTDLVLKMHLPLPSPGSSVGGAIIAPFQVDEGIWQQYPIVADNLFLVPRGRLGALMSALRAHRDYTHLHLLCDWLAAEGTAGRVDYFVRTRHDANSAHEANPLYRMAGRKEGRVPSKAKLRKRKFGSPCVF